ncbi:hypothetical protein ACIGKL_18920 [Pseudomonas sp. NPDC077186]|uniref:hypothetical protein n=1 Tax=Pseudomonas sp. NPDC077186 TaxID=3364421 RepID=UPI0037C84EF5
MELIAWKCIAPAVEVLSDIFGFAGSCALIIPGYRILRESRAIYEARRIMVERLSSLSRGDVLENLNDKLDSVAKMVAAYNPQDAIWVYRGIFLMFLSFSFKLLFHFMTKL